MDNFENKYIERLDCHYSRIIASWANSGGTFNHRRKDRMTFIDWAVTYLALSPNEAYDIWNMATCGKLELETKAKRYLKENED